MSEEVLERVTREKQSDEKIAFRKISKKRYEWLCDSNGIGRGHVMKFCFLAMGYEPPEEITPSIFSLQIELYRAKPEFSKIETLYNEAISAARSGELNANLEAKDAASDHAFPATHFLYFFDWFINSQHELEPAVREFIDYVIGYRGKDVTEPINWHKWVSRIDHDPWHLGDLACILKGINPIDEVEFVIRTLPEELSDALSCTKAEAREITELYTKLCEDLDHEKNLWSTGRYDVIIDSGHVAEWMKKNKYVFHEELLKAREEAIIHSKRMECDPVYRINECMRQGLDVPLSCLNKPYWGLAEAIHIYIGLDPSGRLHAGSDKKLEDDVYDYFEGKSDERLMHEWGCPSPNCLRVFYMEAYAAVRKGALDILNRECIAEPNKWHIDPEAFIKWCKAKFLKATEGESLEVREQLSKREKGYLKISDVELLSGDKLYGAIHQKIIAIKPPKGTRLEALRNCYNEIPHKVYISDDSLRNGYTRYCRKKKVSAWGDES